MEKIHTNISQRTLKARNRYRNRIDVLRSRINLLTGQDRLLITMYLENDNSFRQIARLVGVNVATVARRIHKLAERLIDSEYITCLQNRSRFSPAELAVAKDYFLRGLPIREIASKNKRSIYCIRKTLERIRRIVTNSDSA